MSTRPPLIVIGAGPVGQYAAKAAEAVGFAPILLDAKSRREEGAPGLTLSGRRATAIWGDAETGIQVETDTGETVTGAAALFTATPTGPRAIETGRRPVTGLGPAIDAGTGETAERGVFVLQNTGQGRRYAAAARAVAAAAALYDLSPLPHSSVAAA